MGHLTREQRYKIETFLSEGKKYAYIAGQLNVSRTTIYREVINNCDHRNGQYDADLADRKANKRQKDKKRATRWTPAMVAYVVECLDLRWSPEQIKGYADRMGIECVSHESIYTYIFDNKANGGELHTKLRTNRSRRQKRSNTYKYRGEIPERRDIDERPNIVEERSRIGDLEIDLVIGAKQSGALLTVVNRATGMARIELLKGKSAEEVTTTIKTALKSWKPFLNTITSDNGREFAYHKQVAKYLQIDYFFAKPYHSWERGSTSEHH